MRQKAEAVGLGDWDRLQSRLVLPTARRLYLIGAVAALVVGLLALITALLFQFGTFGSAPTETVPAAVTVAPQDVPVGELDSLFEGPQRLRGEAVPVTLPLSQGAVIGRLAADSVYGIESVELIGGVSADLVTQDESSGTDPLAGGATLRASAALAKRVNERVSGAPLPTLTLRVTARDRNGNRSRPADVTFRLVQENAASTTSETTTERRENVAGPEPLRDVATALARIAAPGDPDAFFDAYRYAADEPVRCRAGGDQHFYAQYRAAFAHVRRKLTAANLPTFYQGLCAAWDAAAARAQGEAQAANERRAAIVARNLAAQTLTALRKTAARRARDAALGVALAAIFFFMVVALFLAFLAIEGHSHAIRQAILALARRDREGGSAELG